MNNFQIIRKINAGVNNIESRLRKKKLVSYPLHLNIVPTKLCNIKCVFCIQYVTGGEKELSLENFKIIAKRLFPYAKMAHFVSGGEPFLNENFLIFLSICRDYHIPARVSTNGMLLSEKICGELIKNDCLKVLRFSFDGAKKETLESLRSGIDYDKVIENMRLLAGLKEKRGRNDLTLLIRYTLMKSNAEELPDLIRVAGKWGIDTIQACYLNIANGIHKEDSLFYHPKLTKRILQESAAVAKTEKIQLILPEPMTQAKIRPCRHPWQFIKIDPDGSVRFCYKAWDNPIGNFFSEDFFALWNSPCYQLIRKTVNSEKPYFKYCRICSWRRGYALESSHIQCLHNDLYNFDHACPL